MKLKTHLGLILLTYLFSCSEDISLEGNWYTESISTTPIHWIQFGEKDFLVMDVFGYTEAGNYTNKSSNLHLNFKDETSFNYPIKIISKDTIVLFDSINLYRVKEKYKFTSPYSLINIETTNTFTYNDLPRKHITIHLGKDDTLKIRLENQLLAVEDILNHIIRGDKNYRNCVVFIGENVSLEDYKKILIELALLNIKKVLMVTNRSRQDKTRYQCIYDNYEFWWKTLENTMNKRNIPIPPPPPQKDYDYFSAVTFIEKSGLITEIKNMDDYFEWKSTLFQKMNQVLKIDKTLPMKDYVFIKEDLSKMVFWQEIKVATMIE